jgi:hypothetical protein
VVHPDMRSELIILCDGGRWHSGDPARESFTYFAISPAEPATWRLDVLALQLARRCVIGEVYVVDE